jgi:hypothetical protein
MEAGYEDIENITKRQNEMLDSSLQQQRDIINQQTALNVAELQRNKDEIDKDVNKTNRALYAEYRKATNPYGANAEGLASRGLGNSGYAETTHTNLYNTYQKNITDTLNNARDLKSDFDFQMSKARQTGDITLAQNSLDILKNRMQLLTQEYEMKNNRKQFLYQQERDRVSDNQWQQQWDYQKQRDSVEDSRWQTQFDYQKQRDAVADSQWEKQYALSKKASASRSSSRSSSKKSSSGGGLVANNGISDIAINTANYLKGLQNKQGILGKMGNAVVNQGKQQVAEMVSKGQLSKADAEYIFEQIGG